MSITFYSENNAFVEKCTEPFFSKSEKMHQWCSPHWKLCFQIFEIYLFL